MSLKNIPSSFILFLITLFSYGQDMNEGFSMLEKGDFSKAAIFFEPIVKEHPENKTAVLCYGRAIGLSGNAQKATNLYSKFLEKNPNDYEVKLNYAESLLWGKNFKEAQGYYKGLVQENEGNFVALLGYANTLSNLKLYEEALINVNKALEVTPGNEGALISKKYIHLGYAYKNQQQQKYDEAELLLNKNLELFENDEQTLINLVNLYIISGKFDKAEATYEIIKTLPEKEGMATNGLALVRHLKGKTKDALVISKVAYENISKIKDTLLVNQTKERYIQALIWNKKFKNAELLINDLITEKPNAVWVLALRATLSTYKSEFTKCIADYNRILEIDSSSFDGNLGKANALKALGKNKEAYTWAGNTLKFYDNQKDAVNFIKTLDRNFTPTIETRAYHSFDNGDNKAYALGANMEFPTSMKLKFLAGYRYRTTSNKVTNHDAKSNAFTFGLAYHLFPSVIFNGTMGVTKAKANNSEYTQFETNLGFNIKPMKLQTLDIGYKREIQSFNAELLDREIVMNNIYANYSLSSNVNLGWFTQYFYTWQNDDNARHLLFTSVYYNILSKPALKGGINYQFITFKNQVPTIYFSPKKFNNVELFLNLIKTNQAAKPKEWFYELTTALGYQFIEDDPKQSTYRIQSTLGYKFSEQSSLNFYGVRSNIASGTASGFTYNEVGLRFKWYITNKPLFKKISNTTDEKAI